MGRMTVKWHCLQARYMKSDACRNETLSNPDFMLSNGIYIYTLQILQPIRTFHKLTEWLRTSTSGTTQRNQRCSSRVSGLAKPNTEHFQSIFLYVSGVTPRLDAAEC